MRGVNKVTLVGNLGRDPDVQYIEGEIPVAKFPLATTEMRKERNGNVVSETEWHTVVLWRGLAELASKYLHKGSLVYIEGRLRTRSWEDKDKNRRFQTEIVGENLVMLEKRRDHDNHSAEVHTEAVKTITTDDLDFGFTKDEDDMGTNTSLPF
ncbi:single-stranded DNA-binding protein [Taibaiella lutea]|uniref:Single-stranded DNA-binding protein n=1 Tax=Taibaiella lutea TaxID=2608001 RepID=A0A5M6CT91_9BACT|nr:single-stranded DNA-binding protein [Taibaiella lutea]KAA5537182.1 single-stranded DNA-binding protein [Taibaiella lutea]